MMRNELRGRTVCRKRHDIGGRFPGIGHERRPSHGPKASNEPFVGAPKSAFSGRHLTPGCMVGGSAQDAVPLRTDR
jgi:hypothetical protein